MWLKVVFCVKEKGKTRYFTLLNVKQVSFNSEYLIIRHGSDVLVYKMCYVLQFDSFIYKEKK